MGYFIKFALESFGSPKDLEETEAFFKDRDTSKYKLPLSQSCDAIRANAAWLEVRSRAILLQGSSSDCILPWQRSSTDVEEWLVKWAAKY